MSAPGRFSTCSRLTPVLSWRMRMLLALPILLLG